MTALEPTPDRVAAARAASGRDWTFGPEGAVEMVHNETLAGMVVAGLIKPHFVTPTQQLAGQDDYYRLTDAGREWLAQAEQEVER